MKKSKPETIRVPTARVKRASQIARIIRIILYLGCAMLLFSQARAEVSFAAESIRLGDKVLKVEIADTDERRAQGLMNRKQLKNGHGMLFIFDEERPLSFWMKNTLIPLSIGYFDKNRKLLETIDMEPAAPMDLSPPTYPSTRPAQYALEVPRGWFKKNNIKSGAQFHFTDLVKRTSDPKK